MSIGHGPKSHDEVRQLLVKAFTRARVSLKCEMCGNDHNWSIVHEGNLDGLGLPLRSGTATMPFPVTSLMVYAIECSQCGNIRQFNKARIERLAREQVEEDERARQLQAVPGIGPR